MGHAVRSFSSGKPISLKHIAVRKVATDTGLKSLAYCKLQRDLTGGDLRNQLLWARLEGNRRSFI